MRSFKKLRLQTAEINPDRQTDRQTDKQTNRQTDRQTDRQKDKRTYRQTDKQTNRQDDRQTDDTKIFFKASRSSQCNAIETQTKLMVKLEFLHFC